MKTKILLLLCLAFFFNACQKTDAPLTPPVATSQTEPTDVAKKEKCKDIEGTLDYAITTDFDLECFDCGAPFFDGGNYFGKGKLKHLGKTTSKTTVCLGLLFDENSNVIGVHVENQCCSFFVDGDEIFLTNDPYDLYINPNTGKAEGTVEFDFAGGTGKYKHAEGSFTGDVVNDLQGAFTADIKGKISY